MIYCKSYFLIFFFLLINAIPTISGAAEAVADLSLTKVVALANDVNDDGHIDYGDTVEFTVSVSNLGPNGASSIDVVDQLPTGYSYVGFTSSIGAYSDTTGVWDVGYMANGATTRILVIEATVLSSGVYENIAQITASSSSDPESGNNTGSATPTIVGANPESDLSLTKAVVVANDVNSDGNINHGDTVNFTLSVLNSGSDDAANVTVSDQLPDGYTYFGATTANGTYDAGTGVWTIGGISNGATASLVIEATVLSGGTYENIAQITASDSSDPDSDNNEDSVTPTIAGPNPESDLSLTKVVAVADDANSDGNINHGDTVNFTLSVLNSGPNDATNVAVSDQLPDGYTYFGATTANGTYDAGTGVWTIGNISNSATASLVIEATVLSGGTYENIAQITASDLPDPNSSNNTDSATPTIAGPNPESDLSLTKVVAVANDANSDGNINYGDTVNFTLSVLNSGPNDATNVAVVDQLPSGYTYVNATTEDGTYNDGTGLWTIGNISNGATVSLVIEATVLSSGVYKNDAQVTASDLPDPDSSVDNYEEGTPLEDDEDTATPVVSQANPIMPPTFYLLLE